MFLHKAKYVNMCGEISSSLFGFGFRIQSWLHCWLQIEANNLGA